MADRALTPEEVNFLKEAERDRTDEPEIDPDQPPAHVLAQFQPGRRGHWAAEADRVKSRSPNWTRVAVKATTSAKVLTANIKAGNTQKNRGSSWRPDDEDHFFEVVFDRADPKADTIWVRYLPKGQ